MLRDYKQEPLKLIQKGSVRIREKPYKEDIIELYIDNNLSVKETAKYFGLNIRFFQKILSEYGIKKDRKKVYELQKKTLLKTSGVENVFQLDTIKEKSKKTCLNKFGKEHYVQTKEYKEKNLETRIKKYGDDPYCREKYKKTCLNRYNVENTSTSLLNKECRKIFISKEKLEKYIKDNNITSSVDLSKSLGCCQATSYYYLQKYELNYLMKPNNSSVEKEVREYINQYYKTIDNKKYLDGKEIDIYIPELNIGIEFNGDYWHNEYCKEVNYHQNKSLLAEEKNIFLYHIFEYEWETKREQIINQLNNLLGVNQEKIYARCCIIKEVSNEEKNVFLKINHLQGNDVSSIKLGLYYNSELVSIMTFVKPRFYKKYQYELSRFCSKAGCNVIGGASKLWCYFISTYNPTSVISYSNIAHTRGKLYEKLGFKLQNISEPNYVWCKSGKILTRYQCQKHKLLEQGYTGNSESDIMHNLGYYRIFDCGNKVWIWQNDKKYFVNDK